MDLNILNVDFGANEWEVTRAIAAILHTEDEFKPQEGGRLLNFKVRLNAREVGVRNDGTGILTLPSHKVYIICNDNRLRLNTYRLAKHF